MKTLSLLFTFLLITVFSNAQSFNLTDTFDSNENGWTEIVEKRGESIITEGVLRLRSKDDNKGYESHCFTNLDVQSNFEIKCDVLAKNINEESVFGLILNYFDNGNYILFSVKEGNAYCTKFRDNKVVGEISNSIKLKGKRNSNVSLAIKKMTGKLEFEVNGMKAFEVRYIELASSGIGFYVYGKQTVSFDNLEVIQ